MGAKRAPAQTETAHHKGGSCDAASHFGRRAVASLAHCARRTRHPAPGILPGRPRPLRLRCSLDTAPTHGRNIAVADYLAKLEKASDGAIKPELFASWIALFNDLDVAKALIQGQVEMALPGTWTLTGLVPDCRHVPAAGAVWPADRRDP